MTRPKLLVLSASLVAFMATCGRAEVRVVVNHNDNDHATRQFKFETVPPPSANDAATPAEFTVVYGDKDGEAGWVDQLHDGKLPTWEDQPPENFCFASGPGGRLAVDLRRAINVAQVNSYSWHPDTRGPQVYTLWASDGSAANFNARPGKGTDPPTCGWKKIVDVDTRPKQGNPGGQYGVSIRDSDAAALGRYRYLLFDISRTEQADDWGNTFYSEIDVIDADAPPPTAVATTLSPPFQVDPPGDPMDWKPPAAPPPLREKYDAATYDRLKKVELAKIDLKALRAPDRPVDGLLVQRVLPGSQATAAGIKTGDIVTSLDGAPLGWKSDDQDLNGSRNGMPQQLTFWSAGAGQKTVTIQPGLIGVGFYGGWRAADAYARSADGDPRWDDDMLVAATSFITDADLAETALFHATRAGYDGPLLPRLRTRIAFGQCQFEQALALQWPIRGRRLSDDDVKLLNDAARLSFKLEQSLDLGRRFPGVLGNQEQVAAAVTSYRALPRRLRPNPLAEISELHPRRCTHYEAFVPQENPESADASKWAAPLLNSRHVLPFTFESGHYFSAVLTPGFSNAALAVHFQVHDTDQTPTGFARCISFGLYDLSKAQPHGPLPADAITVSLFTDGPVIIAPFGLPELKYLPARPHPAGELEETIRIAIVGNRCEVALDDGRRLFYGPALADESKREYGFFVQAVGVSGRILIPIWEQVDDPPQGAATRP